MSERGKLGKIEESVDERLDRLARETASLKPRAGFNQRVMAAIQAEAAAASAPRGVSWLSGVAMSSRRVLITAALAAACGVALAAVGERSANESLAASYTAVEMEIDW
jgi:hypothetical protein